jgi:hypothetical protein
MMLNKAQLDALVIDGDGHDEDVIALFAHARESLTVIAARDATIKRLRTTLEGATPFRNFDGSVRHWRISPSAYDAALAPTEPTSAENELEFDDGMNEGEGEQQEQGFAGADLIAQTEVTASAPSSHRATLMKLWDHVHAMLLLMEEDVNQLAEDERRIEA